MKPIESVLGARQSHTGVIAVIPLRDRSSIQKFINEKFNEPVERYIELFEMRYDAKAWLIKTKTRLIFYINQDTNKFKEMDLIKWQIDNLKDTKIDIKELGENELEICSGKSIIFDPNLISKERLSLEINEIMDKPLVTLESVYENLSDAAIDAAKKVIKTASQVGSLHISNRPQLFITMKKFLMSKAIKMGNRLEEFPNKVDKAIELARKDIKTASQVGSLHISNRPQLFIEKFSEHIRMLIPDSKKKEDKKEIKEVNSEIKVSKVKVIKSMLSRFHLIARELRERHDSRDTLIVNDEYDVQDLLRSLLKLEFEDIRSEEWTPSYAGKCSRMDFLLKNEKIVIETKKTRNGLDEKEVGDQIAIDFAHYQSHPDCKTLVCFIYDPDNKIRNPIGLIGDLENLGTDNLSVQVVINP